MRVKSYESQFELPKVQEDALKKIVRDKTGLDEMELNICTTKKVQAVLNESEIWLMLQVEISSEKEDENKNDLDNWIAKTFILIKIKGPDTLFESSHEVNNNIGISNLGSKDMEDFLKEISYNAKRIYGPEEDIEVELKASSLPSSHMALFLLIWKKSMVKKVRENPSNK
jgi:hypothetical protein